MSVLEAEAVERDWDERPFFREGVGEAWVMECLGGEAAERRDEVELAAVFQAMDQFQGAWIADGGGACEKEGEFQFATIRAVEGAVDRSGEGLAAAGAKGGHEARQVIGTGVAKGAALGERDFANRATCWVEQIEGAGEEFAPGGGVRIQLERHAVGGGGGGRRNGSRGSRQAG